MDQQQHYLIPGTAASTAQQSNLLQEQEYQQLLFNQQQYLNSINMPMIYNQAQVKEFIKILTF